MGEENDAQHVVVGALVVGLRDLGLGLGFDYEAVGLGLCRELVLGHREGGQRRIRVLERPRRDPGVDGRLELDSKPLEVEVAEQLVVARIRVDHCVKTATSICVCCPASVDALPDSTRAALAALNAIACSPLQRVA